MGCDWYNDGDNAAKLAIQLHAVDETGARTDEDSLTVTVPPGGKVYMEQLCGGEVKRR